MDTPQITPKNHTLNKGSTINLSCKANGSKELIYQWKFQNKIVSTQSNLLLENVTENNEGEYECVVSMEKIVKKATRYLTVNCK